LAESEPHADGFFKCDTAGLDGFVFQQRYEAAAAGVRPQVGTEQVPQIHARFKCGLALANPFEHIVTPAPMLDEFQILLDEVERQIHFAALQVELAAGRIGIEGRRRKHILALDQVVSHLHDPIEPFDADCRAHQQRREFMGLRPGNLYEFTVTKYQGNPSFTLSV